MYVLTNSLEDIPPPGAYNNKYYDIATKVIKEEEDPDLSPKKVPFNSTEARFKAPKIPEVSKTNFTGLF